MPKTKENIIELKRYRQVTMPKIEKMHIEDFFNLPPVFCQRQTEYRAPKTKKLLKNKFFPSHLDVAIFEYPNGKRVKGNGNTRDACWKEFANEELHELIPEYVNATIYPVKDKEVAKALYYTFDSDESVEKAPDKITGVYRALNLNLNNAKIAKGNIGKSLQFASSGRDSNPTKRTRNFDWFEIIKDFKDELIKFDSINPKKIFDANLTCTALMMLKRHGVNNTRLLEGLLQINNGIKGIQIPGEGTDGATRILEEWSTHTLFEQKGTDGISFPQQQDFLICCLEKWMNNEKVKYRRPSRKGGKGCRQNAYEAFWDDED